MTHGWCKPLTQGHNLNNILDTGSLYEATNQIVWVGALRLQTHIIFRCKSMETCDPQDGISFEPGHNLSQLGRGPSYNEQLVNTNIKGRGLTILDIR